MSSVDLFSLFMSLLGTNSSKNYKRYFFFLNEKNTPVGEIADDEQWLGANNARDISLSQIAWFYNKSLPLWVSPRKSIYSWFRKSDSARFSKQKKNTRQWLSGKRGKIVRMRLCRRYISPRSFLLFPLLEIQYAAAMQ